MTPLSICWLLIELFVIPNGFLKWFYLSFYIHPFLLALCQLFLWIIVLLKFLLNLILFVYRISCFLISYVLTLLKCCVLFFKKYFIISNRNPVPIEEDEEYYDIPHPENQNEIVLCRSLNMRSKPNGTVPLNVRNKSPDMIYVYDFQTRVSQMFANNHNISSLLEPNSESMDLEEHEEEYPSEELVEDYSVIYSIDEEMNIVDNYKTVALSPTNGLILSDTELELELSPSSSVSSSPAGINPRRNEYFPSPISSNSSPADYGTSNQNSPSLSSYNNTMAMDQQLAIRKNCAEEEDLLYQKYAESMSWFDILNHDRLSAISTVLRKQLSSANSFLYEMEPTGLPVQYISWSKVARKRLLKSLESDLELVYVAQSCLSWEALLHQYRKIEALSCSASENGVFYGNIAARFQKFQVLLERFVEDDSCGGKRHFNYVHRRFSQKNLLQVPEVSGYVESNERLNGEKNKAVEVLKAIEKCVNAFWFYLRTDSKKTLSWKKNNFLRSHSCVEDPRDIWLLHDLTKKLQMKELWLKDVKGKRRCWLRRAIKPQQLGEYCTKIEYMFTLIDMKLVSRVLHMSIISTSHLKWCQHKLNNIEFKDGQILRTPTSLLFPST
ncbi:uncharacterized protein LOC107778331 isoform X1 [Nicotiana tabacum]|uniref:Uncharacterized protein LOC107778331 isoform X1 n=1 Tax=Nicotiana tabacum TaxID=4097 RepID=A0A1S3YPT4_TOBAC|nr:PREDICTED: uncharacterized protein LOC107778331 isoform X1 [Nicotiana tabacum]